MPTAKLCSCYAVRRISSTRLLYKAKPFGLTDRYIYDRFYAMSSFMQKYRPITAMLRTQGLPFAIMMIGGNGLNLLVNIILGRAVAAEDFAVFTFLAAIAQITAVGFNGLAQTVSHAVATETAENREVKATHDGKIIPARLSPFCARMFSYSLVAAATWLVLSPFLALLFKTSLLPIIAFAPVFVLGTILALDRGELAGRFMFRRGASLLFADAATRVAVVGVLIALGIGGYAYVVFPLGLVASYVLARRWLALPAPFYAGAWLRYGQRAIGRLPTKAKNFLRPSKETSEYHAANESVPPVRQIFEEMASSQARTADTSVSMFFFFAALGGAATLAFLSIDMVLVKIFFPPAVAGQYAVLSLAGKLLFFGGTIITGFMIPLVAQKDGTAPDSRYILYAFLAGTGALLAFGMVFLFTLGDRFLIWYFGVKAIPIMTLLPAYAIAIATFSLAHVFALYHLAEKRYQFPALAALPGLFVAAGIIVFHESMIEVVNVLLTVGVVYLSATITLHIAVSTSDVDVFAHMNEMVRRPFTAFATRARGVRVAERPLALRTHLTPSSRSGNTIGRLGRNTWRGIVRLARAMRRTGSVTRNRVLIPMRTFTESSVLRARAFAAERTILRQAKRARGELSHNNLRILILNWRDVNHRRAGGAEVYAREMAKGLTAVGHRVTFFSGNDGSEARYDTADGVRIIRRGGFHTVYLWAALYYIFKLRTQTDIIIDCENGVPFFTPIYARKPIYCVVHHIHLDVFRRELSRPAARLASFLEGTLMPLVYRRKRFIVVSDSTKQELAALGVAESRIAIVPNGIDTEAFIPGEKSPDPTVLYLGRIEPYKSVDVALRAFRDILRAVPSARLIVAGEGVATPRLKRLAMELNITEATSFPGKVSEKHKKSLLQSAWVFIQPSFKEGWGITVMEAAASGTPTVASNVAGLRDAVRNPHTGYLAPYGDAGAFAEKISSLLIDESLRKNMERSAVAWSKEFEWEKSRGKMVELIREY